MPMETGMPTADLAAAALGVLRIVSALLFMEHGCRKLFDFPRVADNVEPRRWSLVWYAGVLEVAGGTLLLVGLFTRPAAFLLSGEMAFAYVIGHAPKSFWPSVNGGDAAILFCFVFLYVAAAGGGAFSVDALLGRGW